MVLLTLGIQFRSILRKETLNAQADALPSVGITAEAQKVDDLEIPCFVVGSDENSTKGWLDDICDNILASETLEPHTKAPSRVYLPNCGFANNNATHHVRRFELGSMEDMN